MRGLAFEITDFDILRGLQRFAAPNADIPGVYDVNGMKDAVAGIHSPDPELYWWYNREDPRFIGVHSHPYNSLPGGVNDFHHNKTLILDDRLVITGSYNFSHAAETNAEDL